MSIIAYKNRITDEFVSSTSHSVSSGTLTATTSIDKAHNRSIMDAYIYENTTGTTHTIDFNLSGAGTVLNVGVIAILGIKADATTAPNTKVQILHSAFTTYDTGTTPNIQRERYINGELYFDQIWITNGTTLGNPSRFRIIITGHTDGEIGSLYLGDAVDINVAPRSLRYQFETQGEKTRTEGGQIISSRNSSFMEASFSTTATNETDVIEKYFDINYQSSISEPIIFIPQNDENIVLYGTQKKPNVTRALEGRRNNQWLYETSFNIEEEL